MSVKIEVFEVDAVPHEVKSIDYKLFKLQENLLKIKIRSDFENNKDNYYLLTLIQYMSDSLALGK